MRTRAHTHPLQEAARKRAEEDARRQAEAAAAAAAAAEVGFDAEQATSMLPTKPLSY
jgi:hypothetical protein